jgi:hypothetical protein
VEELVRTLLVVIVLIVGISVLVRIVFKRSLREILWDWINQIF